MLTAEAKIQGCTGREKHHLLLQNVNIEANIQKQLGKDEGKQYFYEKKGEYKMELYKL